MATAPAPPRSAPTLGIVGLVAACALVRAADVAPAAAPVPVPLAGGARSPEIGGPGIYDAIAQGYAAVRALRPMKPGAEFTLDTVDGPLTGRNDDFLRRRTGAQVIASGLSSGCGDNALAFAEATGRLPVDLLLVEGAEVSSESLLSSFSGHVVVAVRAREGPDRSWILVDSTQRRLISEPWSPEAKSFVAGGRCYWIGYCGPLDRYPAHTGSELRQAYAAALAQVPPALWAQHTVRLRFVRDGELHNPRAVHLDEDEERLGRVMTDPSERNVTIHLRDGGPDAQTSLTYTDAGGWSAALGQQSGCHPSLLGYFERTVLRDQAGAEASRP